MRQFVTMDDLLCEEYNTLRAMSDESRIESMGSKMDKSAFQAMVSYKQMQRNMGSLDPDLDVDWLKYSNVMIKICNETGC